MLLDNLRTSSAKGERRARWAFVPERWRRWVTRFWIAVPGFASTMYGIGSPANGYSRIWHDCGLPFFLLAATLPIWRKPEPSLSSALRWRELQRKVFWRAGVLSVLAAIIALIAHRWNAWYGDVAAAHAFSRIGLVSLLLSPVPPLLDPLLWRAWPAQVRNTVRATRTAEALAKSGSKALARFDPERGAGGRPHPLMEYGGGAPRAAPIILPVRSAPRKPPVTLEWDGSTLAVCGGIGRGGWIRVIPLAGRPREKAYRPMSSRRPAVELIWLSYRNPSGKRLPKYWYATLFFLDEEGYRVLTVTPAQCTWPEAIKLAKAAGLSFAAYDLKCVPGRYDEICARLFPRRISSRSI